MTKGQKLPGLSEEARSCSYSAVISRVKTPKNVFIAK